MMGNVLPENIYMYMSNIYIYIIVDKNATEYIFLFEIRNIGKQV